MRSWPPLNLILTIFFFIVINTGFTLQNGLFANIPQPLELMFNESFYKHYGEYLDVVGMSTIWSVATVCQKMGQIIGIFCIVPLIDKVGRKFVAVHIRFFIIVISAIVLLFAYYLPSFEAFLIVLILESALVQVKLSSIIFYLSECAPPKYRGVAVIVICMGEPIASIVSLTVFRPSLFGNEEKWFMIPIISMVVGSIAILYLYWLPETPHQLTVRDKPLKAIEALKFFGREGEDTEPLFSPNHKDIKSERTVGYWTILTTPAYREILLLICFMYMLQEISPNVVSSTFSVKLHTILGFEVETIMTIGTVQRIVFMPAFLLSSYSVDRFGRRSILLTGFGILFVQNLLLMTATSLSFLGGPSTSTIVIGIICDALSGLFGSLAASGMITLLLCELTPACSRIAILQLSSVFAITLSTVFYAVVPYALNFFPPLPFLTILILHTGLISYVYRNLPETAGREIPNVVTDIGRSRVSTRRATIVEELAPLLSTK